jgi:DNA polymerase-3 subunit alpha
LSFIHLHNHTHYSLLDGANDIKKLIRKAADLKMPSLAITDHGNMFGALEFYQIAREAGVKPIIGMESYIAPGSRKIKKAGGKTGSKTAFHLLLLAKNNTGYKNLMKLSSIGYLEGFYYKPRIDREVLKRYSEGIICTSACMNGEVFYYLARGNENEARKTIEDYMEIFGEDYYLEIQNHELPDEVGYEKVYKLAKDMGVPVIATNDVHYLERSHHTSHDILICLQSGKSLNDPNRLRYQTEELYLKSVDEMLKAFPGKTDALERTLEIDEKINIDIDLGKPLLPPFPLPEEHKESSLEDHLRDLALKGVEKKFSNITPKIRDRLQFELEVINRMGFPSYFLIVKDFIDYARNHDIPVGLGRGSAAGSLVAYALGITRVDPFRFDLLFERFLNPDRISMPDIDIDFCYERRDEVINYVRKKYGEESVAQIITFGTMASRGVIRDVARVLGLEYAEADRISKLIPISQGKPMPIKEAFKKIPQLKEIAENENKQYRELIKHSEVLEGLARHASVHAAGIVIAPGDITNYVPLYKTEDQYKQTVITTQYSMVGCEHIGLLKMDFLGLRTLTVLHDTISMLKERGIDLDLDNLPLDDKSTHEIFCEGNTVGVFQFESKGMREFLRKLKPNRIEDLIAMNALYRPGPMENIDTYIDRKSGSEKIKYLHPKLKPILQETYGIIVYQEQVMRIASELGGFSLAKADLLRRAMGKKKKGIMAKMQKEFLGGCTTSHIDKKVAEDIYELIFKFASYGFNKSHSAAYALLAYQTAYLKSHYPAEFMAANLNSERNDPPRIVVLIEECKRMNLEVLPPDINYSHPKFGVTKRGEISFGLEAIKNVGKAAIKNITKMREKEGPFKNIFQFMQHLDLRAVNKKILEALIQAGAMDSLEGSRAQKFAAIETVINFAQKTQEQNQNTSQITLFDVINEKSESQVIDTFLQYPSLPDIPEWSIQERLNREKELLGFYISGHPLDKFEREIQLFSTLDWDNPSTFQEGSVIKTTAIVSSVRTHLDKKGKFMAFLTLEDRYNSFEAVVFSSVYEKYGVNIGAGEQVFVIGKVSNAAENSFKILCDEIFPLSEVRNRMAGFVKITINTKEFSKDKIDSLLNTVKEFPGSVPLIFEFLTNGGGQGLTMKSQKYQVLLSDEFIDKIRKIVGNNSVNINN